VVAHGARCTNYKQPILADIDFDDDGWMVIPIRSTVQRTNARPIKKSKPSFFATESNTLRFCKIGDSYVTRPRGVWVHKAK
jgi:hypothetical protein